MRRQPSGKRLELTDRDIAIFRLLQRYRYLRSTFIHAFVGGASVTRFKERLGALYHDGRYLDRPKQQWQFAGCRSTPVVYETTPLAERVLRECGPAANSSCVPVGGRHAGQHRQFAHVLMICEIVASIELATRGTQGLRLVSWHEILGKAPPETHSATNPMRMPVTITYAGHHMSGGQHVDTAVIPDAIFGLAYDRPDGTTQYRFFALEADRGMMPLHRAYLRQSSYLRKLLAYREAVARSQYRSQLGLPNFLVLTVTTSVHRAQRMITLLDDLTDGTGSAMFLFKAIPASPEPCARLLLEPWQRAGHPPLRVDQANESYFG